MKKRIYYFYIILISLTSFINQERIAFAETANTPTNEFLNKKEDKRSIKAKDSEIYAGDLWNPKDNFVSATDEAGNPLYWGNSQIAVNTYSFDPNTVGSYQILYYFSYTDIRSAIYIKVKPSIEAKDSEIYAGDLWNPKDNFVSATDENGNPVYWGDSRITCTGTVDVSKPGINEIEYRITRNGNVIRSKAKVRVKEDKSSIKTKDSEKYVGERWDPKENFVSATDEDGHSVPWEDPRIIKNGASIDTSKPGIHKMKYTHRGKVKDIDSEFTVTVKKEAFTIKEVPFFDFEDHILASTNKSVVNKKENPIIEVETPSIEGKDWQLQVELSPFLDKENSNSILKGVSLFIPKGKLESDLETEEPNQYDCQLEANGKASILMHGTKTKGKGRWKNKLETKGITLSIPPENKTGNYESTLHWTLLDVPG
ncbi:bacterial Ig-like domain-containing protein [Enterococcus faecalis]|nr:bacterial Ig-like domain-containing protein [Enterococcus faecalis]